MNNPNHFPITRRFASNHPQMIPMMRALNVVGMLKEGMAEIPVFKRFPKVESTLRQGVVTTNTIVLMVDLSPFSTFVANSTPMQIQVVLNAYYERAVSLIENRGGVVEKFIGDAVVAIFGAPFNGELDSTTDELLAAFEAGRELIDEMHTLFGAELTAKCAIDVGSCFLGYVGPESHPELTVIGNPLTTLFRLEDRAIRESVIMRTALYERIEPKLPIAKNTLESILAGWNVSHDVVELRGVGPAVGVTSAVRRR